MVTLALLSALAQQPVFFAERADLAERLLAFEAAWSEQGDDARRRKAIPVFSAAVTGFLGGDARAACQAIDRAVAVLLGTEPDPLDALSLRVSPMVLNPGESLRWEVRWSYDPGPVGPVEVRVDDETYTLARGAVLRGVVASVEDATLLMVDAGSRSWAVEVPVIPGIADLARRAEASARPEARGFAELYRRREGAEVQPEWERLVDRIDRLLQDPGARPGPDVPLALEGGTWLRASLPGQTPGALVVAVHGAGGSENLFFDGYGRGRAAALAAQRGWAFVGPRAGATAVKDAVAYYTAVYGGAPERLFLMGHSMGGAMVLNALRSGVRADAVVLFAPAAAAWPVEAKDVPAFLAVGKQELAMLARSAEGLRRSREDVVVVQPDPCEHYLVVGEAVDAAYRFLDGVVAGGGR